MKSTPAIMNWISRAPSNSAASPDRSSLEVLNVKSAPVLRGRLIELGEIYDSACAGESVGNDRLTLLAQLEGDDERWSAQFHALPRLARLGSRRRDEYV